MKQYQEYWKYIIENNKGRHNKTKEKLYKRVLSRRRAWVNDYGIEDIDGLIMGSLGSGCPYCKEIVTTENMSLDHKLPVSRGGSSEADNIHIVCNRCNKRKGQMRHEAYVSLLKLLDSFSKDDRDYVLHHMSMNVWTY